MTWVFDLLCEFVRYLAGCYVYVVAGSEASVIDPRLLAWLLGDAP